MTQLIYLQGVANFGNIGRSTVTLISVKEGRRAALDEIVHHVRKGVVVVIATISMRRGTDAHRAAREAKQSVGGGARFAFHPVPVELRRTACFVHRRDERHGSFPGWHVLEVEIYGPVPCRVFAGRRLNILEEGIISIRCSYGRPRAA